MFLADGLAHHVEHLAALRSISGQAVLISLHSEKELEGSAMSAFGRSSQLALLGAAPSVRPLDGQIFARKAAEDRLAGR